MSETQEGGDFVPTEGELRQQKQRHQAMWGTDDYQEAYIRHERDIASLEAALAQAEYEGYDNDPLMDALMDALRTARAETARLLGERTNLEAALAQAEERAALADVAEAFAQQLALKSVNHGPYNVVWNGDYDSINDNSLRELVRNYLWARLKVRGEADFDALTHIEGGKEEMKWPVKP